MSDRLHALAAALDARPVEVVGLVVLAVGGVLAAWLLAVAPAAAPTSEVPGAVTWDDSASITGGQVTVHVAGAVRRPGVARLAAGSRVADAVAAAGGARADADLDGLNLAAVLEDGQQVVVPASAAREEQAATVAGGARDADGRIDLNRATVDDLDALPGIGPVLAARIVSWRDQHGPFREPGQLRQVPGIGERTFQALADLIRV